MALKVITIETDTFVMVWSPTTTAPKRQTSFWLYMLNMYAAAATKRFRQPMNISWLLNAGGVEVGGNRFFFFVFVCVVGRAVPVLTTVCALSI